ncbi:MAG: hypothetical protein KGL63_12075, partial [Betaproteobacteria bacterium]|nr:hypothetical protein [Betaproteobacteria bacterium]
MAVKQHVAVVVGLGAAVPAGGRRHGERPRVRRRWVGGGQRSEVEQEHQHLAGVGGLAGPGESGGGGETAPHFPSAGPGSLSRCPLVVWYLPPSVSAAVAFPALPF